MNASVFTDDEGESTDTADSSEQEYRYSLRLLYNNQIICTCGGNWNTVTDTWHMLLMSLLFVVDNMIFHSQPLETWLLIENWENMIQKIVGKINI
jgi:hypothetical protein